MKKLTLKIIIFEILALGISWVLLPFLRNLLLPSFAANFDQYFSAFGPLLSSICVVLYFEKEKFVNFYKHSFIDFSHFWKWAIIAFVLPIDAFMIAIIWGHSVLHQPVNFALINTLDDFGNIGFISGIVILILTTGIGEESGWRGYLLPALSEKYNPLIATLIISILWGIWHIPLFIGNAGFNMVGGLEMWIAGLVINAFILTWLYLKSKNPFVPAIFHGTLDALYNIHITPVKIAPIVTLILFIGAVFLVINSFQNFWERKSLVG